MSLPRLGFSALLSMSIIGCTTRAADTNVTFSPSDGRSVIISGAFCAYEKDKYCGVLMSDPNGRTHRVLQVVPANTLTYNVFIVEPGRYIVRLIHTYDRTTCTTKPATPDETINFGIDVKPGEVVYTGDIAMKMSKKCPVDALKITQNLKRAQAELAKYPGIQGKLDYRPWFSKPAILAPESEAPTNSDLKSDPSAVRPLSAPTTDLN